MAKITEKSVVKSTAKSAVKNMSIKLNDAQMRGLWDNATPANGQNLNIYRVDVAGAFMKLNQLNKESEFGWVVQPITPIKPGDKPTPNNCVAMHWKNAAVFKADGKDWEARITGSIVSDSKKAGIIRNIPTKKIIKSNAFMTLHHSFLWDYKLIVEQESE